MYPPVNIIVVIVVYIQCLVDRDAWAVQVSLATGWDDLPKAPRGW